MFSYEDESDWMNKTWAGIERFRYESRSPGRVSKCARLIAEPILSASAWLDWTRFELCTSGVLLLSTEPHIRSSFDLFLPVSFDNDPNLIFPRCNKNVDVCIVHMVLTKTAYFSLCLDQYLWTLNLYRQHIIYNLQSVGTHIEKYHPINVWLLINKNVMFQILITYIERVWHYIPL